MNNYDTSSTGENIDFCVFYDTSLAEMYFDDWLKGYNGDEVNKIDLGGRDNYLYLIGDADKSYYSKTELQKMSKQALFELWINYEFCYYVELNDYKKSEYIADLMQVTIRRHYEYLASQGDTDNGKYPVYATCGYSQGDYAEYCYIGEMPHWYKNYIHHIFWDCPISIRAEINGREYCEDDFLNDDFYQWDIDAVKARIMAWNDCSDYAKNWIIENLPEYPDYN